MIIAALCLQLLAGACCCGVCGVCSQSTQALLWKEKQTNGYGYGIDYSLFLFTCYIFNSVFFFFLILCIEFKKRTDLVGGWSFSVYEVQRVMVCN